MRSKTDRKQIIYRGMSALFLLCIMFVFMMRSPLNPWTNTASGVDSSVFRYMGFIMSKGYMPYKDAFDHKGPLLYIISYIGQLLSYDRGIWYVECLSMLAFLCAIYKIARLHCTRFTSCALILAATAPLSSCFEGGNLVEEYALPFLAVSLYIFLDYFLNENINKARLLLCGFCFGAVFLLRANMVSVWMVFAIAVLIWNIYHNRSIPWDFLLWFMVGFLIIALPIFLWLVIGGAFGDFLNAYFVFNMKYSSADAGVTLSNKYKALMSFLSMQMLLVVITMLIYLIREKKDVFLHVTYLVYIGITLLTMAMSGLVYWHYAMILLPVFIYPLSRVCAAWNQNENTKGLELLLAIVLVIMNFEVWKGNCDNIVSALRDSHETLDISEGVETALQVIDVNTTPEDRILVIGNWDFYYVASHRMASTKYSYQIPIAGIDEAIKEEFQNDLVHQAPKIVIVTDFTNEEQMNLFTTKDNYELLYESDENSAIYRLK